MLEVLIKNERFILFIYFYKEKKCFEDKHFFFSEKLGMSPISFKETNNDKIRKLENVQFLFLISFVCSFKIFFIVFPGIIQ